MTRLYTTIAICLHLLFIASTCNAFVSNTRSHFVAPSVASKLKPARRRQLSSPSTLSSDQERDESPRLEKWADRISCSDAMKVAAPYLNVEHASKQLKMQTLTLLRVGIPSIISGVVATIAFPALALGLCTIFNDAGVFTVLSTDSSQFVQNFLSVSGVLFSMLVGQTYYFMYQQQEAVFYALFNEVTEAKSLLEQVALVCQGRSMYKQVLQSIALYVENDLKQLQADPAVLLSARPVDDPLEAIMYSTSVGVPSTVYETVRSLRQARAGRLGALQRKLPSVHMLLLWLLGLIELVSFPLLGAGTQTIGGYNILTVEGYLFGVMTAGIVLTLKVVGELRRPAGGAYNVDSVLSVMVRGLEEELHARMAGTKVYAAKLLSPSPPANPSPANTKTSPDSLPIVQQGADVWVALKTIWKWLSHRRRTK